MRRSVLLFAMVIMISLISIGTVSLYADPGYDPSVFSPNNVIYDIAISMHMETYNVTNNALLSTHDFIMAGKITLISKRMELGYVAWGAIVEINVTEKDNGTIVSNEYFNVSAPPILAVKENTRYMYLTELIVELLREGFENVDMEELVSRIATNKPYSGFYIYNPFYIDTSVNIGDRIPYGFYNETRDEGVIVYGTVTSEKKLVISGAPYDCWIVNITEAEILEALEPLLGEEDIPEGIEFNLGLFYDKRSGWLVGLDMFGGGTISVDEQENAVVDLNGEMELVNAGTVRIADKTYIDRILGLPAYTSLALDILMIIAIVIIRVRRR